MVSMSGNEDEEKLINEEYKIWKKNSPHLYDLLITHALEWPSLTFEWFSDIESQPAKGYNINKCLIGTHTSDGEQNYLQVCNVSLPNQDAMIDSSKFEAAENDEAGGYGGNEAKIVMTQKIPHVGEVNRARISPTNQSIVATYSPSGSIYIFDLTKHPNQPKLNSDKTSVANITCKGHTEEGWGLSFFNDGKRLVSSDESGTVCIWDLNSFTKAQSTMSPVHTFKPHSLSCTDIQAHPLHPYLFASTSDDKLLLIHDTRSSTVAQKYDTDKMGCSLSWNWFHEYVLAVGEDQGQVGIWDLRAGRVHTCVNTDEAVKGDVRTVQFNPSMPSVLLSSSSRRIRIHDLSRIAEEGENQEEEGPSDLVFIHGGHTGVVSDVAWMKQGRTVGSVSEDNMLMVWEGEGSCF